jgi:hypothetical protein
MEPREEINRENVRKTLNHLFEAIERVREDVDKVELWAVVLNGFLNQIPDYDPLDAKVWLPNEQASSLQDKGSRRASASARTARPSHRGPESGSANRGRRA